MQAHNADMPLLLLTACREEWRLLFNSDRDGKSFNTLLGRLADVTGPTLLLVGQRAEDSHSCLEHLPA